jgi:hypothetical protein
MEQPNQHYVEIFNINFIRKWRRLAKPRRKIPRGQERAGRSGHTGCTSFIHAVKTENTGP